MTIMTAGDSRLYTAELFIPDENSVDAPFVIDPVADTVQLAIVSKDLTTRYTEPLTLVSTTPGADWSKSIVAFKFPRAATADIVFPSSGKQELKAILEVQVTFDALGVADDWTWRIEGVILVPGKIP